MSVRWGYFNKFDGTIEQYLPATGEGETKASQIVTAINKLIYKWYNDGDVYDNTRGLEGWCNDLSSYANWLDQNTDDHVHEILECVWDCYNDSGYEDLLKDIADYLLDPEKLEQYDKIEKTGTIYECDGRFEFVEAEEETEDDLY